MLIEKELGMFVESEENNGALLITGKWGCGKSYLIKKYANELNAEQCYAIAVVSLFGVENITGLNARVRDAYLEFATGVWGKKTRKIYGTLKKIATDSANITAAALPESATASAVSMGVSSVFSFNPLNYIKVKNMVGLGDKQRRFVLVFDDFERCNIDKGDLLGAINEYVENRGIKVIIVADELKINDNSYMEFKEKVIARTLQISINHPQIIDSIIKNYKTDNMDYKQFLLKSRDCIIGAFIHSSYNNLRTVKSCLMDFERIFDVWCQVKAPVDYIEDIFYKFCAIIYETKNGNYSIGPYGGYAVVTTEKDSSKREDAVRQIKSKYLNGAFDYVPISISKWIVSGVWDSEMLKNELRQTYLRNEFSYEERFIMSHFWDLEQVDIDQGMPILLERAYNGEANCDELITLLQKTHALKKYNIKFSCDVDYKRIIQGLDKRSEGIKNGIIHEPKKRTFTENNQIDEEAIPINAKIEKMADRMYVWENRRVLISYLNGGKNVSQYKYNLKNICIEAFDDELYQLFITRYLASKNADKIELCHILLGIDFINSYYSPPEAREISFKNHKTLASTIKELPDYNCSSIDSAIHKSFIERLENRIIEIQGLDTK